MSVCHSLWRGLFPLWCIFRECRAVVCMLDFSQLYQTVFLCSQRVDLDSWVLSISDSKPTPWVIPASCLPQSLVIQPTCKSQQLSHQNVCSLSSSISYFLLAPLFVNSHPSLVFHTTRIDTTVPCCHYLQMLQNLDTHFFTHLNLNPSPSYSVMAELLQASLSHPWSEPCALPNVILLLSSFTE